MYYDALWFIDFIFGVHGIFQKSQERDDDDAFFSYEMKKFK